MKIDGNHSSLQAGGWGWGKKPLNWGIPFLEGAFKVTEQSFGASLLHGSPRQTYPFEMKDKEG